MSFNPRQALERIRQGKGSAPSASRMFDDREVSGSQPPLFEDSRVSESRGAVPPVETQSIISQLSRKVESLERVTKDLSKDLAESMQTVQQLKRQKSQLETHILKLEYESTQIRNKAMRESKAKKDTPDKQLKPPKQLKQSRQSKEMLHQERSPKAKPIMLTQSSLTTKSIPNLPATVLQPIMREPIDSVLYRKERNFKAVKKGKEANKYGNRQLSELAQIMKEYPQMSSPVIVIALNEADFE